MCGGAQWALECLGGRRTAGNWHWLGPGNTTDTGYWILDTGYWDPGIPLPVPTRYTHPPVPTHRTPLPGHATPRTALYESTKEILGVDNAHAAPGIAQPVLHVLCLLPQPPYAHARLGSQ